MPTTTGSVTTSGSPSAGGIAGSGTTGSGTTGSGTTGSGTTGARGAFTPEAAGAPRPDVDRPRDGDGAHRRGRQRAAPRVFALAGVVVALVLAFLLFVRPWYRQWGATPAEVRRALPGDEVVPDAARQETRAITIRAGVDRVWPWLAQLGQDRGGFYSYDLLENLVGCRMPTTDVLRPAKQSWRLGDTLWMYPRDRAGGVGFATLDVYVPGRALGFATRAPGTSLDRPTDGSWSFVLEPVGDTATRLLVRGRGAPGRSLLGTAFDLAVFEPMHFAMERRTMTGIQQLAEGYSRRRLVNHAHVALWTVTFALLVAAVVATLRRREHWLRPLAGVVVAAVVFQILTLGQPPLMAGVALVLAVAVVLWWPAPRFAATERAAGATP